MNIYHESQLSVESLDIVSDEGIDSKLYRRSQMEIILINLLVPTLSLISILMCLAPRMGFQQSWLVFVINIILTTHIAALTHELMHEPKSSTDWNWLLKINLHLYSPATLGFSELRRLHLLHHLHADTPLDPDYFLIDGGRFRSFFVLAFAPEFWFFSALRMKETQSNFWVLQTTRVLLFTIFLCVLGWEDFILLFYIPSKISFAVGFLIFSYESHTDFEGKNHNNTYNLKPKFNIVHTFLKLVIGSYSYNIAFNHAIHHRLPWASGRKLGAINEEQYSFSDRQFFC
jgi:hypothetical protein